MTLFLRPIADTLSTQIASGEFTAIDEASASDADYIRTNTVPVGVGFYAAYECLLTNPGGRPRPGSSMFLFRWQEESGGGGDLTIRARIYEGATQHFSVNIDVGADAVWYSEALPIDLSAISNWSDVRARFEFAIAGGSPARGRLSFAALEVPDLLPGSGMMAMF